MKKDSVQLKNIRFQDTQLFQEGENYFNSGKKEEALERFILFSDKHPNGKTFVAGRIAITLMELGRFVEAKDYLNSIISENNLSPTERRRDHECLYAECLRNLGEIKLSEEKCFIALKEYPGPNSDVEKLLKKVSIHPHLDVLRLYMDWNERKECLLAIDGIIEILYNDDDMEEAVTYSSVLISLANNYSIRPYLILGDYYNKAGWYYKCLTLLEKLEKSMVPLIERNSSFERILSIYKNSHCYRYSKYYLEAEQVSVAAPAEGSTEYRIEEVVKLYSLTDLIKYLPVLNLDKYFAKEPQLVLA